MKLSTLLVVMVAIFSLISLTMLQSIASSTVPSQLFFFLAGALVLIASARTPFDVWLNLAKPMYVLIVVLLILTFAVGKTTKGSTRWISLGIAQIQPSQFAKPILALFFVSLASRYAFKRSREVLYYVFLAALPLALVFIEPDLGTTIILVIIVATVTLFSRIPFRWIALLCGVGLIFGLGTWSFALHDYQRDRLLAFLQPQKDILGTSYQSSQAMIAVGSGRLFGRGLGRGAQSNLQFLPEKQTDFFFASLAEELGLAGTLLVLVVYAGFFWILLRRAHALSDSAAKLYAYTISTMLFVQMSVNIGMNVGLLPITGITLPLLSLGGSSIVSICLALGILASAVKSQHKRSLIEFTTFL